MLEIKTITDLRSLKEQGILKEGYIRAIETCFYEFAEASDLPEGAEPCLDSGSFRILDPDTDDWRNLILHDGGIWFEWCERIDICEGGFVYKPCCLEDNDWMVTYWIEGGKNPELDELMEEHLDS